VLYLIDDDSGEVCGISSAQCLKHGSAAGAIECAAHHVRTLENLGTDLLLLRIGRIPRLQQENQRAQYQHCYTQINFQWLVHCTTWYNSVTSLLSITVSQLMITV
jgi:hypothetical protein